MTDDELIEAVRHAAEERSGSRSDPVAIDPSSFPASVDPRMVARLTDPKFLAMLNQSSARLRDMLGVERMTEPGVIQSPATAAAIEDAEASLGVALPPLLRRLYVEIGNGGFGPGYGVLGLVGGATDSRGHSAIDLHRRWPTETTEVLLPICHWGCGIYSLIECAPDPGRMWGCDPNADSGGDGPLRDAELDFHGWLTLWVEGRLQQAASTRDEESGEWRIATQAEVRGWIGES